MLPRLLGVVALAWLVPVLWLGGASAAALAFTAAFLAIGLGVATLGSATMLRNTRVAVEATACVGLISGLIAVSWVPTAWPAVHADPEGSLALLSWVLVLGGFGILGSIAGAQTVRRRDVVPGLAVITAIVAGIALVHGGLGLRAQWGWVPVRHDPVRPFLPFVNPDHLGTLAVFGLPSAVALARDARRAVGWQRAGVVAGVVLAGAIVVSGSQGAWGALGAVAALAAWRAGHRALAVGLVVVAGVVGGWYGLHEVSATARLEVWKAGLSAWRASPLLGVGAGAFSSAVEPYRRDHDAVVWGHAHADPVEWLVETGLLGVGVLGFAAWLGRPRPLRPDGDPWPIDLGIFAVLVHSCVDFPLRVPLIGGLVAVAWGIRRAVFEVRRPISSGRARAATALATVLVAGAAALSARQATCETALAALAAGDSHARKVLDDWGWLGPEARMSEVVADGDAAEIEHLTQRWPGRGEVWRAAAGGRARLGDVDGALQALDAAERAGPADWRTFAARGRLLRTRDPAKAAEAWIGAFSRGAPWQLMDEAYAAFPVAVWWVDAVEGLPPHVAWALARAAMAGDTDAAMLALDLAERGAPGQYTKTRIEVALVGRRYAGAAALAETFLADHPEDADTWVALANARQGEGDLGGAIAALDRAATLNGDYRAALVRTLGEAGRADEARRRMRGWTLAGGLSHDTYVAYAEVLARDGDGVGCSAVVEQLRTVSGRDESALRQICGRQ